MNKTSVAVNGKIYHDPLEEVNLKETVLLLIVPVLAIPILLFLSVAVVMGT